MDSLKGTVILFTPHTGNGLTKALGLCKNMESASKLFKARTGIARGGGGLLLSISAVYQATSFFFCRVFCFILRRCCSKSNPGTGPVWSNEKIRRAYVGRMLYLFPHVSAAMFFFHLFGGN